MERGHGCGGGRCVPQMKALAQANAVHRSFGAVRALEDFDVSVSKGQIVGLIGPSGSGKTTAMRLMIGVDRPTTGTAQLFGTNAMEIDRQTRARLGFLAQNPALIEEMTIAEQVKFAGRLRRTPTSAMKETLDVVGLTESAGTRISDASGGMRRRAGLAAVLINRPELAFLDEPTAGLDPIIRDRLWTHFRELTEAGRAMLVSTQHIDEASRCDRVVILRNGVVVADDAPQRLTDASGLDETVDIDLAPDQRHTGLRILIEHLPKSTTIQRSGETTIRIGSPDAASTAAHAAELIAAAGLTVLAMNTAVPSLDEVFRAIVENS